MDRSLIVISILFFEVIDNITMYVCMYVTVCNSMYVCMYDVCIFIYIYYIYIYYRTPDICRDTFGILLASLHNFTLKNPKHRPCQWVVWSHQLRCFLALARRFMPGGGKPTNTDPHGGEPA